MWKYVTVACVVFTCGCADDTASADEFKISIDSGASQVIANGNDSSLMGGRVELVFRSGSYADAADSVEIGLEVIAQGLQMGSVIKPGYCEQVAMQRGVDPSTVQEEYVVFEVGSDLTLVVVAGRCVFPNVVLVLGT